MISTSFRIVARIPAATGRLILAFALAAPITLTGCEQLRTSIGDVLNPPGAAEITVRVTALAAEGKVAEAIKMGEEFLLKKPDSSGDLHKKLAQLYTERGDTVSALRHLQRSTGSGGNGVAVQGSSPAPEQPTPPPAAPAPQATPAPAPAPDRPAPPTAGTGGVSVSIGPNGVEARAGDVSAKVQR